LIPKSTVKAVGCFEMFNSSSKWDLEEFILWKWVWCMPLKKWLSGFCYCMWLL